MYTMFQINHIKDLSNCGYRISEISKKTGADPKTIRKYFSQEDFSPVPPVVQTNHPSWILLSLLSRSGLMRIKNTGANNITLHSGYMNAWLKNRDIQAATVLSSAI